MKLGQVTRIIVRSRLQRPDLNLKANSAKANRFGFTVNRARNMRDRLASWTVAQVFGMC